MLRFQSHDLFALSLLVTSLCHQPAQALGVHFDLAQPPSTTPTTNDGNKDSRQTNHRTKDSPTARPKSFKPLPIPSAASQPPININTVKTALPTNVIPTTRVLTPPPSEALPTTRILASKNYSRPSEPIALRFKSGQPEVPSLSPPPLAQTPTQSTLPNWIYDGGSDSLVARVIGSAEGTRTAGGNRTRAYYGHTDPGNSVWNIGTFSYQHGANSPQAADQKQLKRLRHQGKTMANQANQAELTMTLGEILNGLDLANQSPRAALEQGGYIDRLVQAREQGMENGDAIVWARTYSYLDPKTQRWNAPGLGNTLKSIQRDQNRRHDAIDQAFQHYQAQREQTGQPLNHTLTEPSIALTQPLTPPPAVVDPLLAPQPGQAIHVHSPALPLEFRVAESSSSPIQSRSSG